MTREIMEYDVVIVGAGPAGLTAAIRLKQLAAGAGREVSVCVLEKGSEVGAHMLSGAVLEPRALNELIPDWKEQGAPLDTPVTEDHFLYLTETKAYEAARPRRRCTTTATTSSAWAMSCRWLAEQAEGLGVEIYPGLRRRRGAVRRGRARSAASPPATWASAGMASRRTSYKPGMELHGRLDDVRRRLPRLARQGAVRALQSARRRRSADLRHRHQGAVGDRSGQAQAGPGRSTPSAGRWTPGPMAARSCTTSENNQVSVGFVIGLDYANPYLSPFDEFQRFKPHPDDPRVSSRAGGASPTARAR